MNEPWLEELSYDQCLDLLRAGTVGRIGVIVHDAPIVLPVNYRLVETLDLTFLAIRTRPGNVIERAGLMVAFEIDGIDTVHHQGWSVLVRGTLHRVNPDAADFRQRFDSHPWLTADRDAWLVIQPFGITGRQLHPAEQEWGFNIRAYM
jgi:nitroimidazol reductase NimA-like FMN-containing flavoprotein (pyridoxamine 5'-phosphate oxidase superfamily)